MKTKNILLAFLTLASTTFVFAQGTFVYDQQSSTDEDYPYGGGRIQFYGTVGQSFTPSLSAVGFIRQKFYDINPGNALGATLVVNLRANAINGMIIGTTIPVNMADGFTGSTNFFLRLLSL